MFSTKFSPFLEKNEIILLGLKEIRSHASSESLVFPKFDRMKISDVRIPGETI